MLSDSSRRMREQCFSCFATCRPRALRGGGRVWKFEGRAMVGAELCCEATFMAMFDVPKA
jgi:hypothetical protein